jgi:hypothetical protein
MVGELAAQRGIVLVQARSNLIVIGQRGTDPIVAEQVTRLLHLKNGGALFGAGSFQPAAGAQLLQNAKQRRVTALVAQHGQQPLAGVAEAAVPGSSHGDKAPAQIVAEGNAFYVAGDQPAPGFNFVDPEEELGKLQRCLHPIVVGAASSQVRQANFQLAQPLALCGDCPFIEAQNTAALAVKRRPQVFAAEMGWVVVETGPRGMDRGVIALQPPQQSVQLAAPAFGAQHGPQEIHVAVSQRQGKNACRSDSATTCCR